jgi:hypothetical protein
MVRLEPVPGGGWHSAEGSGFALGEVVFSPGLVLCMYLISCLLIYVYKLDNI